MSQVLIPHLRQARRRFASILACASAVAAVPAVITLGTQTAVAAQITPSTPPAVQSQVFGYTGSVQHLTVPPNVYTIIISAQGAGGGNGIGYLSGSAPQHLQDGTIALPPQGGAGGPGQIINGQIPVTPGQVLDIYVGARGGDGVSDIGSGTVGAGGDASGAADTGGPGGNQGPTVWAYPSGVGGGGGGGTLISTKGKTLVLAGGGGGGGGAWNTSQTIGGSGGAGGHNGTKGLDTSVTPPTTFSWPYTDAPWPSTTGIVGASGSMSGTAGQDAFNDPYLAFVNTAGGGGGGGGSHGGSGGPFTAGGGGGSGATDGSVRDFTWSDATASTNGSVTASWAPLYANNVVSSTGNITIGQNATLFDTLTPNDEATPTPTGTVTFTEVNLATGDQTVIGTVPVGPLTGNRASATIKVGSLPGGNDGIIVTYNGDSLYPASTSQQFIQTVLRGYPQQTMTSSATTVGFGTPVTLNATIAAATAGAATPTGSVTFNWQNATGLLTPVATANLDTNGHATWTGPLPAGKYKLFATYSGDNNYAIGSPAYVNETVNVAPASVNDTITQWSSITNLTASVTSPTPGTPVPTGSVLFYGQTSSLLGSATLDSTGKATIILAWFNHTAGYDTVYAVYSGDSVYPGALSPMTLAFLQ